MGYVLALDVGGKRIGVAVASRIARLPAPHSVIETDKTKDIFAAVKQLADEMSADTVVIGLPRGMDGQETAQTAAARDFAAGLSARLDIPVVMQDEAVTSVEAEQRLKNRGKPYSKGDIDAEAAAMILDDYLKTAGERVS